MAYLTVSLPDDWEEMTPLGQNDHLEATVWAPLEGYTASQLWDLIEYHAKTIAAVPLVIPPTYNHMYTIAFEVKGSICDEGEDVTAQQLCNALMMRVERLADDEWLEAVGAPDDSFEITS